MKLFLFSLAMLCAASAIAGAQQVGFQSAWFGTVGGGIGAYDNGPFSRRLQSYTPAANGEDLLYRSQEFSNVATVLTASGSVLLGKRYIIGASGERVIFPVMETINGPENPRDEFTLTGGGGALEFGYSVINQQGILIYPFAQAGYYGFTLDYHNAQSDSIPFFEGEPVAPGTTATYTGAAPRIGLGIGLTKYIGSLNPDAPNSGLVLSARLAWGTMPGRPEWEQDGTVVNNGGHTPCYNGVSLTISIGGGGAWW